MCSNNKWCKSYLWGVYSLGVRVRFLFVLVFLEKGPLFRLKLTWLCRALFSMSDANFKALQDAVHCQQLQIKSLAGQLSTLTEEGLVLRQFLDQLGIVPIETFLARIHRHRFEVTSHASHFDASAAFDDIMFLPELVSTTYLI